MFNKYSMIRHKESGEYYHVMLLPTECRIEKTDSPAYAYRSITTSLVWVRPSDEMEDGRFEQIT